MNKFENTDISILKGISNYSYIIAVVLIIVSLFTMPTGILLLLVAVVLMFNGRYFSKLINEKQRQLAQTKSSTVQKTIPSTQEIERQQLIRNRPSIKDRLAYDAWEDKYHETFLDKTIHYSAHPDVLYQFDISNLLFYCSYTKKITNEDCYFIPQEYYEKVKNYLQSINTLLSNFSRKTPAFPSIVYSSTQLKFERTDKSINDFCVFLHHPLTQTGKLSKFPYSLTLRFGKEDLSQIKIYFDKFGSFIKGELICWHNKKCYLLTASVFNKELQITKAYINNNGKKEKIFDITEK